MDSSTEQALIEQAKTDPEAFGAIFDFYYPKIFSYALKRTGTVEAAQDITSEVFVLALDKLWQFTWKKDSRFSSWLYKIATNEITGFFRKGQKAPYSLQYLMEGEEFDPPSKEALLEEIMAAQDAWERDRTAMLAQKLLRELPLKYQEVIILRYFEDKTNQEISEILGKRPGTVKSLLSRGLKKLYKVMLTEKEICNPDTSNPLYL